MKIVKRKLQMNKGESLAEVLVAILIIAVGLVLLSSLVLASTHMVERGNTKMKAIYEGENAMEIASSQGTVANPDGTAASQDGIATSKGTATITWGNASSANISVNVYQDKKTDGKPNASGLISYKKAKQ